MGRLIDDHYWLKDSSDFGSIIGYLNVDVKGGIVVDLIKTVCQMMKNYYLLAVYVWNYQSSLLFN